MIYHNLKSHPSSSIYIIHISSIYHPYIIHLSMAFPAPNASRLWRQIRHGQLHPGALRGAVGTGAARAGSAGRAQGGGPH